MEDITTTRRRQKSCTDLGCAAKGFPCVDTETASGCDATDDTLCGTSCTCCIMCNQTTECKGYGGSCSKISAGCSGTSYDAGCAASTCTCCIADNSTCVTLPACRDAGGLCIAPSQSGNCTGVLDPNGCLGDSCSCCKGGCDKTNKCTAVGGYCFRKDGPHVCHGKVFKFCGLGNCRCCVDPHWHGHGLGYVNGIWNSIWNGNGNGR
ncbi:keratin-associated protein 5-1-like isoform X2 [Macrobrachium nipponense]|uniref:keratin-associated protein 5-1-like isoform X2 n=1 Tax=Macrobrachium nipponense TaxID=159736 RepID=UPI0030C8BC5B